MDTQTLFRSAQVSRTLYAVRCLVAAGTTSTYPGLLDFGTLIPSSTGVVRSDSMIVDVSTNSPGGYNLKLNAANGDNNMNHAILPDVIAPVGDGSTTGIITNPVALTANTWGFALPSSQANLETNGFNNSYSPPEDGPISSSKWAAVPTTATTIKTTGTASPSGDATEVYYAAAADLTIPAGTYTGNVVYTATLNDVPAPTITSVLPAAGSISGGTTITITGTNFYADQGAVVQVTVDGNICTSIWLSL